MKRMCYILLLAASLGVSGTAYGDSALERRFLWNEANARMQEASSRKDFEEAAVTYGELADMGGASGPLFFNMGVALLKAERFEEARLALLRAERRLGTTPEIRRNLILAYAEGDMDQPASLPWQRVPLFWHYGFSTGARLTAAVAAYAVLWLALILDLFGARKLRRLLVPVAVAIMVVLGASAAISLIEEARDNARDWSAMAHDNPEGAP